MLRPLLLPSLLLLVLAAPRPVHAQPGLPRPSWLQLGRAAPGAFTDDPATPLGAAARRIANDVPHEGTPDPGEHYPISNEFRHDLWFEHVRDLGGAFVGVGTDQCYTLAAVQNASMIWVVDFDPLVPVIHRLYAVLVPASESPEALVARFAEENETATVELLRAQLGESEDADGVVQAFRRNRARMFPYLRRVLRNRPEGTAASWLSDPSLYARVRALHRAGRVVARNGDVTAEGALRAVGRVARELDVSVRVVYFSNAEQFFPYTADFRANLEGLPTDERSIVLRTFRERGIPYPRGDRWHYVVQPIADMQARIVENGYRHSRQFVRDLMHARRSVGEDGVSVLDGTVPRRFDLTRPR